MPCMGVERMEELLCENLRAVIAQLGLNVSL
jgi:hypothetical protein